MLLRTGVLQAATIAAVSLWLSGCTARYCGIEARVSASPTEFSAVSVTDGDGCVLSTSGELHCWGEHPYGVQSPAGRFRQVDAVAGSPYACGIEESGKVTCWGVHDEILKGVPKGSWTHASGGKGLACVASGHALFCWGIQFNNFLWLFSSKIASMDVTGAQMCVTLEDLSSFCIGPEQEASIEPPDVPLAKVSVQELYACGIRGDDSSIVCWGLDEEAPKPSAENRYKWSARDRIVGYRRFERAAALNKWIEEGGIEASAERKSENADEEGESDYSPGPFQEWLDSVFPDSNHVIRRLAKQWGLDEPPGGKFIDISTGHHVACAIDVDGRIHCWGHPGMADCAPPPGKFKQISVGGYGGFNACAIRDDGKLVCWGEDNHGVTTPLL